MTVVKNEKDKLIPQRTVTGWRVCIDYRKLNNATRKDHFPLPFINQMLERLAGHEYYCFLDGFLGYFHIHIASKDQENTTFTCPYGTFAYKQMSFGLWNVPATFQRCMTAIFHELIENSIEVFMGDFSVSEAPLTTASISVRAKIDKHFKPINYASKTVNEAQENYTTTENELLAVVFAFDKFRQYLVLSKTIVFTDHSTLRYLFIKQDAKPLLIRWIQLLQEVDIKICDKKGAENLAADHLSRFENPDLGKLTMAEIWDLFPKEQLMTVSDKNNEPWCVAEDKAAQILRQCHSGPLGGHLGITTTARKVFKAEFYWPNIFRNVCRLVQVCDACQRADNISLRDETPQKYIQVYKIFDVWGLDFMGPFLSSNGNKYILVAIDYLSKWVEAQAFLTNDARNVVNFLKKLFARFGILKALISDRGTHLCNYQIEQAMKRLFPEKLKSRWYGPFSVKPYQKDVLEADKHDDITLDGEGEVTKFLIKNKEEIFTVRGDDIVIKPDGVVAPTM
ncbi:reverse transcriptase domain-containing protein [Tanacetum coccineum]